MTEKAEVDLFIQYKEVVEQLVPCVRTMGIKLLEMTPRRVKLLMPLAGNESHIGSMYAGIQFTLAEYIGGALHLCSFDVNKYIPIVKHMEITYKKPAMTDLTITIELPQEEVDRIHREAGEKGKCDFILNGELKDANGNIVAETKGTYQIRSMA